MKFVITLIVLFWIPAIALPAFAGQSDSIAVDSSNIEQEEEDDDYYIVAIGGIGMTTGASLSYWENDFHNGVVFGAGVEFPLFKSHLFGFKIYPNFWISKKKSDASFYPKLEKYIKVSENYYSAFSTLWQLKYYIGNKDCFIRLSLDIGGYSFESLDLLYDGIETGLTLYFNISDEYYINISRLINFKIPNLAGSIKNITAPNYLMLNFCYKIRM